jgi:NAD(P)-dependent dehydrogenase (short-subunit alcohol dehydrogenase family)
LDFRELDDRSVLITGGADGIGLALGELFRSAGARVFLVDVDAGKLARSAARIGAASAVCDVADAAAVERAVEQAWQALGPIDLLCANAGVVSQGSLLEMSREELDWIFGVNVWGILHASRAYVKRVRESRREGHILMTGSETSLSYPAFTHSLPIHAYVMSKHCVLAMADSLRVQLASDRIGVSVLCPGPVSTGLGQNSGRLRPGALAPPGAGADPSLDPGALRAMGELGRTPAQVAATALEGLRQGLFVIPTHPHIRDDVSRRHAEIERGFRLLLGD